MRRIELQSLTLENFRSFRQRTTIEFTPTSGLKFISGDNRKEPRLGANGAGKSTIWDGVTFCLFNSSVKGVRASDLISWGGAKSSYAKTVWLIAGEEVSIERQSAPNRLLVDGQACEEAIVEQLLGLSKARFLQAVIFGQAVKLFIDLDVPTRGALLDEVLDLNVWLRASDNAGKKQTALAAQLSGLDLALAHKRGQLAGISDTTGLQEQADCWEKEQAARIDDVIRQVEEAEAQLAELERKKRVAQKNYEALPDLTKARKELDTLRAAKAKKDAEYQTLFAKLQENIKALDFHAKNRKCPACGVEMSPVSRDAHMERLRREGRDFKPMMQRVGAEGNQIQKTIEDREEDYNKDSRKRDHFLQVKATAEAEYAAQVRAIESAERIVEQMAGTENPYLAQLNQKGAEKEQLLAAIEKQEREKEALQARSLQLGFWRDAFKRVRLFVVKQVLAQLQIETAAASSTLGLIGWTIAFSTELENKSGTIKPGIFVQITSPEASAPWEAWSGGEAQRIRQAVTFGFSALVQRLAGVDYGFEAWDEPSAWLSPEGIEDLLDSLKSRAESSGKSLWLCDHRALIYAGFDEIWCVTKTEEGSKMTLVNSLEG